MSNQRATSQRLILRLAAHRDKARVQRFLKDTRHPLAITASLPGGKGVRAYTAMRSDRLIGYGYLSSSHFYVSRVSHVGTVQLFAKQGQFAELSNLLYEKLLQYAKAVSLRRLNAQEIGSNSLALGWWLEHGFSIEGLLGEIVSVGTGKEDLVLLGVRI